MKKEVFNLPLPTLGQRKEVLFSVFLLLISLASADFQVGNLSHSIPKEYAAGGNITGWINISLNNEPGNSLFKDSEGNSIELLTLLKRNSGLSYNCSAINCSYDFNIKAISTSTNVGFNVNQSKFFGFGFTGDITKINSLTFNISSPVGPSCNNQVKIDFLDDGIYEAGNIVATDSLSCGNTREYGCFEMLNSTKEKDISNTPYCQKIKIKEAPGLKLGAYVKKIGSGSGDLIMQLYDGASEKTSCKLDTSSPELLGGREISCNVNFLVTNEKDYYVCIFSNAASTYRTLENEAPVKRCGFFGVPIKASIAAYRIFSESRAFGSVGDIGISNNLSSGNTTSRLIEDYIKKRYGSLDCSQRECLVPMRIWSGANQEISIFNIKYNYNERSGPTTKNAIYDLEKVPSSISMKYQKIYLDNAGFKLPSEEGNITYSLDFNDEEIFSEKIKLGGVPVIEIILPTTAALGFETKFKAKASAAEGNITRYDWNFDGTKKTTLINEVTNTFVTLGKHNLTLTVRDKNNRSSSKTIEINVISPEEEINKSIQKLRNSITSIKSSLNTLPLFYQESLETALDIDNVESSLTQIEREFGNASTQEEYLEIISSLSEIELPSTAAITKEANSIIFFPQREDINLDILESIGTGTYEIEREQDYIDAVISWHQKNVEIKVSHKEISGVSQGISEPLLNIFELSIEEKEPLSESPYLIIKDMENLIFKENYGQEKALGYNNIIIEPGQGTITFSTTEDIDFIDLPAFISPSLDKIKPVKACEGESCIPEPNTKKWWYFAIIILSILVGAYIIYAVLYNWYKYKYEMHLFKNRNNLFNLVTYINNQKRRGEPDNEIIKRLKNEKWTSEQINYVMRKYVGKRTGMIELPLLGLFLGKRKQEQRLDTKPRFSYSQRGF